MARHHQSLVAISRSALVLSALAALVAGGCSSSCQDPAQVATDRAPAPAFASDPDDGSVSGLGADGLIDVPSGEALVRFENGRVTLVANAYPQMGLLGKLSRAAEFEQTRSQGRERSANVSVRLQEVTLEEAIAAVLTGLEFQIHYAFDDALQRSVLTKVSLGGDKQRMAQMKQQRRGKNDRKQRGSKTRDPEQRAEDARLAAELAANRDAEIELGLASSDDKERAGAVDRLRPEGSEFETLKDLLVNDSNPNVRRLAAERLETSHGGTAIDALVVALGDRDTTVVLAAIEALEFAADNEHIPMILASGGDRHPDPGVREAFAEMIDFLE